MDLTGMRQTLTSSLADLPQELRFDIAPTLNENNLDEDGGRESRKLKDRYRAAINARRRQDGPSGTDVLTGILARFGIVREGNESLAETTRAMGLTARELRAELQRRAARITAGP